MQGMVPLCGFGGVPYSAIRKAAPRNLLDNSDFRNPVNQRGITSETSVPAYSYFLDRWVNQTSEVRSYGLSANGITLPLQTTILQKIEKVAEGTVLTFAIKLSDGTIALLTGTTHYTSDGTWTRFASVTHSFGDMYMETNNGVVNVVVYNTEVITIVWAALYGGVYTETTKPEYHPKGYGAELAECQRYYQNLSTIDNAFDVVLNGFVSNTSTALAVSLPGMSKMRITPTVVFSGGIVVRGNNGYSSDATYGTPYMSPNVVSRLNTLVFYKSDNSAWAGIDNNTNISISLKLGSILSLSADL